nr:MAG TPA: hypothetical protein [Caudoviricetes sp.]
MNQARLPYYWEAGLLLFLRYYVTKDTAAPSFQSVSS